MDGFAGVTAIETRTGCDTARLADAEMELDVAVMVALPIPVPVANPALDTEATLGEEDVQLAELVRV